MIMFILNLILGSIVMVALAMLVLLPYMTLRWAVRKFCYRVLGINLYTIAEKKLIGIFKETDDPYYYLGGDYRRAKEAAEAEIRTVEAKIVHVSVKITEDEHEEYKQKNEEIKKRRSQSVAKAAQQLNAPPERKRLW